MTEREKLMVARDRLRNARLMLADARELSASEIPYCFGAANFVQLDQEIASRILEIEAELARIIERAAKNTA